MYIYIIRMKRIFCIAQLLCCILWLTSCVKENDGSWDPYYNWQARNAAWYEQIADSARSAIAQAKAQYPNGEDWKAHCQWRMERSLQRSEFVGGPVTDSICIHIRQMGTDTISPLYTDTVGICFRGWTMQTEYEGPSDTRITSMGMFTQTFTGAYSPQTARPQKMLVSSTVEGFSTALQYMVKGDVWDVYIPQQLAYGDKASSTIPAYSTLLFRIYYVE